MLMANVSQEWVESFSKDWSDICNFLNNLHYPLNKVFIKPNKIPRKGLSAHHFEETPVGAFDDKGNLVRKYSSMTAAAKDIGVDESSIRKACYGALKRVRGLYFCVLEEN